MKVLLWSAVLGSVPVCLMYLVERNRPGPGDGVFDILTVFALMPGYYCMVVVSWIVPLNRVGSKLGMAIAILFGAPGRALSLGGESPLHTRQGEVLAERQGCPSRGGI